MSAPKAMTRPRMLKEAAKYKNIRHRAAYTAKAMMWHKGDRNRYCGAYYTGGCPTCFAANTLINFFFDAPLKDVRALLAHDPMDIGCRGDVTMTGSDHALGDEQS